MKRIILTMIVLSLGMMGCDDVKFAEGLQGINEVLTTGGDLPLTNTEVVAGLKEALNRGVNLGSQKASALDGFYKNPLIFIPIPEEAQKVKNTVIDLGLQSEVDRFEMTLNRAAEEASKKAAPIFIDAITGMSIQDGFQILNGGESAATEYLKTKTTAALTSEFSPVVQDAIETVQLAQHWQTIASAYNTATILTGGDAVNPDLQGYVTEKAISGLFTHIETEEKRIRANPQARVTDLLKKVFGSVE